MFLTAPGSFAPGQDGTQGGSAPGSFGSAGGSLPGSGKQTSFLSHFYS